jgi:uncharacterized protein (DUF1501 family)
MAARTNFSRRQWLRYSAASGVGGACSGWLCALAESADPRNLKKSVILLWMNGGPATIDLWDLKPGHEHGGPFKEIQTAAPGVRISEKLHLLADWTDRMAIVRSMTSKEGDHARAAHLVRTGYAPQASIDFPDLGALVAHESAAHADLPNFVSIAPPQRIVFNGGGFLDPDGAPLVIGQGATVPGDLNVADLKSPAGLDDRRQLRRRRLLRQFDGRFVGQHSHSALEAYDSSAKRATRLMRPEVARAFQLEDEKDKTRAAYGQTVFGQSCLLARRLVERGVAFVETTLDGWDTHQDNFERVGDLAGQLDSGFAALLSDLHDRGLLDSTLVVCMGEFGRTPKINASVGRDHWPHAWSAVLAGGGIPGGQAIGRTSADGTAVQSEPTHVPDLIAAICNIIGVDPMKQNESNVGRPIRIADPDAIPIRGLS